MLSYQNDNKSWRKQNFPNLIFIPKMRFLLEVEEEEEEERKEGSISSKQKKKGVGWKKRSADYPFLYLN